jgi:hypothetical protein
LVGRLDAAAAIPEVPVPAETQQRWRAALERATETQTTQAKRPSRRPFTNARWLAAAAAAVVALIAVVQFIDKPPTQPIANVTPPVETPAANAGDGSAYERGLKTHLASTERQLASLENATPEERARLVDTIIEQNRIYALAAERAGEPQLARVLRAFSPILESLQHEDGDPAGNVAQLAFELRIMQGRLASGTAPNNVSTTL